MTKRLIVCASVFTIGIFVLLPGAVSNSETFSLASPQPMNGARAKEEVPPYHSEAPAEKDLPPTLDPGKFPDPITQNAYAMAAKIRPVLYQQPCYCHCDKELGHGSLLDCFAGMHAAICNTCKWEGIYAYEQTMKKKSPAQIRAAILKGDWKKVDWQKYQKYDPDLEKH